MKDNPQYLTKPVVIENDKELIRIVTQFSHGLCKNYKKNAHRSGMCWVVSAPLQAFLSVCGYETEIINCEIKQGKQTHVHHCLKMNGSIIDATASQFKTPEGKQMPKVYIGKKPKWYRIIKE